MQQKAVNLTLTINSYQIMKKLQYLSALILLMGLGDVNGSHAESIHLVIFLSSAFILVDELEIHRSTFRYILLLVMVIFNPYYNFWMEMDLIRLFFYVVTSAMFLFKTSNSQFLVVNQSKKLNEAY